MKKIKFVTARIDRAIQKMRSYVIFAIFVAIFILMGMQADAKIGWPYLDGQYFTDTIEWDASAPVSDGTQCDVPIGVTINSGPMVYAVTCADNDASTRYGHVVMPDGWDGGTVTFEIEYVQTAADTNAMDSDIACYCYSPTDTVGNNWGSEVAMDDDDVGGSNKTDHLTSGAVTCGGSCAAGDTLYWRWQVDASGTTTGMATLYFLNVKMEFQKTLND